MEIKVNDVKNGEKEIVVHLNYDEIKDDLNAEFQKERKKIHIDGFRKGKVPVHMIKKMYGEAIEYKASEDIAQKKFWTIVDDEKLSPISPPRLTELEYKGEEGLDFKIQFDVIPELELVDYKDQEIEKPVFKVKEEDIEKDVQYMLKSNATFEKADIVDSTDYRIKVNLQKLDDDGNPVEGTKSEGMLIDLGDEKVSPQIVENAQGKKAGETFNFTFVDEHKHGEETHTHEYKYQAELLEIEKFVLPEVTEELVKKLSHDKASTIDELKEQMREDFKNYFDNQSENLFVNTLLGKVVENNNIEASPDYVETLKERFIEYERQNAQQKKQPFNEQQVAQQMGPRAEWNAKWKIFMDNLVRIEDIKVSEDDLKKIAEEESEKMNIPVDKLLAYYKSTGREEGLLEEKVIDFLKENNKIVEVDPEEKKKAEEKK